MDIADLFDRVADLLEIKGEIIHRVLSYRRAAESIYDLPRDLAAIAADGALTDIPGVGKTLAEKIEEVLSTGKLQFYEKLTAELPAGLVDVMRVMASAQEGQIILGTVTGQRPDHAGGGCSRR